MFGIDNIYWIIINSFASFIFLFIISKLLGKKQIAQLEFIDYAVGISLGSIAAAWATNDSQPFYHFIICMAIYFLLAFFVAIVGRSNTFFKRLFKGKPVTLIYEGKILYKGLLKSKIDVNDLLAMLREKNYFDISDVAYAVFETSGKLSVLPKGNQKPVVVEDVSAPIKKANFTNVLVVDGEISKSGLRELNKDEKWLFSQIGVKNRSALKDVILAVYNENSGSVDVHSKNTQN